MSNSLFPPIAVVGFSGIFPKATGGDDFWRNIVGKVETTVEIPADRWIGPVDWVHNQFPNPDMAYSRHACLVDGFKFDPSGFQLDTILLKAMDPLHQWALHASRQALINCCSDGDGMRTGVILAAIALPTDLSSKISRRFSAWKLFERSTPDMAPARLTLEESLCGRVISSPAAAVSRALGLRGSCYTLDAACASSLYALKLACDELQTYRADIMLAGGVSRPDCLYTQIGFSQLRALSASGRCAPFDHSADGLVVGEGAGVMALKRLEDAIAQGDSILGVIRGIGLSNDMRGNLLAPESAGQVRAMQTAYAKAGWHPHAVDYIECHGAGTPVGDSTELHSLRALWGDKGWAKGQCAIGSIKSMIGHLLTGAGAAGMIKTLLALHHKTLPPSLKFERPAEGSPLLDGPFRVQTEAQPWPQRHDGSPRRAAVSAFGFGGINGHVLVEEWPNPPSVKDNTASIEVIGRSSDASTQRAAIAIVGMDVTLGAIDSVQDFQEAIFNGRSVLTPPPPGRWRMPQIVGELLERGKNSGDTLAYADSTPSPRPSASRGSESLSDASSRENGLSGGFIEKITIELGEFQIPPGEIPDILPQQLLMLKKAAGAMIDAGLPLRQMGERMGAIIGIGFDYEATNFHLRWALPMLVAHLQKSLGLQIGRDELDKWLRASKDDCGPPLTATRTLGALGGIVASRVAREFRLGGPSFVVSAEEASGLRALEIAVGMLRSGDLDAMLVGAVDLNCDERNMATIYNRLGISTKNQVRPFDQEADGTLPGEGAVALVLKRLDDALAENRRIFAVIEGIGSAGCPANDDFRPDARTVADSLARAHEDAGVAPNQIGLLEAHGSGVPDQDRIEAHGLHAFYGERPSYNPEDAIAVGSLKPIAGHTGAVSGLASLVKAALSIHHRIIPPLANFEKPSHPLWHRGVFHIPVKARFWAQNKADGPRRACIGTMTSDGACMHAIIAQAPGDQLTPSAVYPGPHHRPKPMGALPYGLFLIHGPDSVHLLDSLNYLEHWTEARSRDLGVTVEALALAWHTLTRGEPRGNLTLAILADSLERLNTLLDVARQAVATGTSSHMNGRGGICYLPGIDAANRQMAFIYPGSGNHYVGMGRALGVHWPEVLMAMNVSTNRFRSQMLPQWYDPFRVDWSSGWRQEAYANLVADPLRAIFGQVLFGSQMTGVLRGFGLQPDAVIGYSLGESAGLFAMGAWPDRGLMLKRLETSDLFRTRLAGPCQSARQAWGIPNDQPVSWRVAAVNRPKAVVDGTMARLPHVRRLIVNTAGQCVIGGLAEQIEAAITAMQCEAVYLDGVVTVHCDAALPEAHAYKELHRFPTTPVQGVRFYSCSYEKAYELTSEAAAESITRQAMEGFDFPRTIQQAYADGIRIFVEVGPHCSCTRMIDQILADKPHLAVSANLRSEEEPLTVLKCIGTLAAAGFEIDLDGLYGATDALREIPPMPSQKKQGLNGGTPDLPTTGISGSPKTIDVPVGGKPILLRLPLPGQDKSDTIQDGSWPKTPEEPDGQTLPQEYHAGSNENQLLDSQPSLDFHALIARLSENVETTAKAHELYLELNRQMTSQYGEAFDLQNQLLAGLQNEGLDPASPQWTPAHSTARPDTDTRFPVAFNREQCMAFAIGLVGQILGPDFDIVDTFKARVRLPDEPLMLVDRIIQVEGQRLSLGPGRVVTEHDVLPGAWYLDGGRAPVCISVEAGQADLFLCAYLGIDHRVRGERTYRLLDARIRFHRGLPRPGETIRYDIRIDKFVRQEATYLFFFRFEGYIGREHLISMTNGCAGFFTEEEVRNSGGIILTQNDKGPGASLDGTPYEPLLTLADEAYDDSQLEALRRGAPADCFGHDFDGIQLPPALWLPGGRMRLIHRIVALQPRGGRFGKGYVRAEADIHPDDWFLTCHFVDDMVMPGTLMYECCAHTLRVLLMRLGWVTAKTDVAFEPVQGLDCQLKCRGPVTPRTRKVHYAVEIKEIGYHPEPYVIADAHMYADGRYIVFFKDMSMQMSNVTRREIEHFWEQLGRKKSLLEPVPAAKKPSPLFTREHILAFATGKPSDAFGEPYAIFDQRRKIARLPGPPYCFMDRVTNIEPDPWVLKPDGWVEAEYDVPADAWFFAADRSGVMPFCVLLEIALQPCGWLAAYAGSALHSENDLKFRNLGGKAVMHTNLKPADRTLTMRTRLTKVSEAADMIIEHFDFEVLDHASAVYSGTTYFGFFTPKALAQQVGLREAAYVPHDQELKGAEPSTLEAASPLTPEAALKEVIFQPRGLLMPGKSLCMIDGIEIYQPHGGPQELGFVRGYKIVDPDEWFFKAHFYQDPVCPGSLGVESFLQLIKYAALQRWPDLKNSHRFEMVNGREHQWSYRGQVIPSNRKVTVEAVITHIKSGDAPVMLANGWLHVDGISIYSMSGFGVTLKPF